MSKVRIRAPIVFKSAQSAVLLPSYDVLVRRLWVAVHFAKRAPAGRILELCLLDTGAPLCVIPFEVHGDQANELSWEPLNDPSGPPVTTYLGIGCDIGRASVWLPNASPPAHDSLGMIAKFPRGPIPKPNLPLILIGLNFFDDNLAGAAFSYRQVGSRGSIEIS